MKATEYQNNLQKMLQEVFPGQICRREWDTVENDSHLSNHTSVYAPRLDIAVGPFNPYGPNLDCGIDDTEIMKAHPFTQCLFEDRLEAGCTWKELWNSFSRCYLAIELEFNGTTKHMLGSLINASVSGSIGIVVVEKQHLEKVGRIEGYIERLEDLGLLELKTFKNLFVFEADCFVEFLSQFLPQTIFTFDQTP